MNRSSDITRFYDKVSLPDSNGCMRWTGGFYPNGYGKAYLSRSRGIERERLAHRLMFELMVEYPSKDRVLMHICDNRWCVAPGHLIQGSQQENIDDMVAKGRANYAKPRRTHCKKGHLYTEETTYVSRAGSRTCKICRRERERGS